MKLRNLSRPGFEPPDWRTRVCANHEATAAIDILSPRSDSPRKNERVTRANNAIKALSERMGVSFIDNGPSFKLEDGSVNDGYLAKDGLHLTAA